jgi:RecA/RadA recombinase
MLGGFFSLSLSCLLTHSIDRMPTVSAAQALEELQAPSATRWVSTGLAQLDATLLRSGEREDGGATSRSGGGGLVRGQVTEIYGPPGVGKTALG